MMVTLDNGDDTYTGSNADITVLSTTTATVTGDDDTVSLEKSVALTLTGYGNSIQAAGADVITLAGVLYAPDTLSGTDLNVTLDGVGTHLNVNGDIIALALDAHDLIVANSDNTNFTGSDDKFYVTGATGGGDAVTGDYDRTILSAGSMLDLDGDTDYVHFGSNARVNVVGTNERLVGAGFYAAGAAGSDFWIGGNGANGAVDQVLASNCTVRIGANSNVSMTGDDDTVFARAGAEAYLWGNGVNAHFGRGAKAIMTSKDPTGAVDVVTGAYFNVTVNASSNIELETLGVTALLGNDVTLAVERSDNIITALASDNISILWGSSNQILLGQNDVITDGGLGSIFQVGDVGATTIHNFGADPNGIIELLSGTGGYTTPESAYAALTSDNAGGVKLSLGSFGSIDFADTSASALSPANFKIG